MSVPVTERAVLQRVNRRLSKIGGHGEIVRKTRGARALQEVGEYYRIDVGTGGVVHQNLDLEHLARELGALAKYESMVEE